MSPHLLPHKAAHSSTHRPAAVTTQAITIQAITQLIQAITSPRKAADLGPLEAAQLARRAFDVIDSDGEGSVTVGAVAAAIERDALVAALLGASGVDRLKETLAGMEPEQACTHVE